MELTAVPKVVNSSKIALKWKQPRNNGAAIIDYMVYKRTVSENGATSNWEFIANTHDLKRLITLERGMTFDFIVTARNKCGEGMKKDSNIKRVEVSEGNSFFYVFFSFFPSFHPSFLPSFIHSFI